MAQTFGPAESIGRGAVEYQSPNAAAAADGCAVIAVGLNLEFTAGPVATRAYVDAAIQAIELTPGPQGPAGANGAQGPAGPNTVSGSTATAINGFVSGNGTNIQSGGSTGATDNAVLRADGSTGRVLQDSMVTITDSGMIVTPANGGIAAGGSAFSGYAITCNGNMLMRGAGGSPIRAFVGRLADWQGSGNSENFCFSAYTAEIHFFANNQFVNGSQALILGGSTNALGKPTTFAPFTFATVPSASANSGATIRITDRSQRLATSDGSNWNWAGTTTAIT